MSGPRNCAPVILPTYIIRADTRPVPLPLSITIYPGAFWLVVLLINVLMQFTLYAFLYTVYVDV